MSADGDPSEWIPVYGTPDTQIPQRLDVLKQLSPQQQFALTVQMMARKVDFLEKQLQQQREQPQQSQGPQWVGQVMNGLLTVAQVVQGLRPVIDPVGAWIKGKAAQMEAQEIAAEASRMELLKEAQVAKQIEKQAIENSILELDKDLKAQAIIKATAEAKKAASMAESWM